MTEPSEQSPEVKVVRKGMLRQSDPDLTPGMVERAVQECFRIAIHPQLGNSYDLTNVHQALIEFEEDRPLHVRVNDEVTWWAISGTENHISLPSERFIALIVDVLPDRVNPLSRWMGFTRSNDGSLIFALDLVGNVARVLPLLHRAHEFHSSARLSLDARLLSPAAAALFSAAEQATMTLIQLVGWNDSRQHDERRKWIVAAANAGDIPSVFADAFRKLDKLRNPARYDAEPIKTTPQELEALWSTTGQLIEYARGQRKDLEDDLSSGR